MTTRRSVRPGAVVADNADAAPVIEQSLADSRAEAAIEAEEAAMDELAALSAQADDPHIWVQVSQPSLAEVVERFGVRGMSVRGLRGHDAFDYELGDG